VKNACLSNDFRASPVQNQKKQYLSVKTDSIQLQDISTNAASCHSSESKTIEAGGRHSHLDQGAIRLFKTN
jgi:hypothetical protein